jgi:hypothetical protein
LRPGKKIVQAWRATGWWPDHYSIAILKAAVAWFAAILEFHPGFQNDRIATFELGAMTVIIDAGSIDTPATLLIDFVAKRTASTIVNGNSQLHHGGDHISS